MRCARCDQIAVPQVLAQLPDGRLAFGLCSRCVQDEHGTTLFKGRLGGRRRLGFGPKRLSCLLPPGVEWNPLVIPAERSPTKPRRLPRGETLTAIRHGLAVAAMLLIVLGIVRHDPQRDPIIVLVAMLTMAASVFVGWVEQRQEGTTKPRPSTEIL